MHVSRNSVGDDHWIRLFSAAGEVASFSFVNGTASSTSATPASAAFECRRPPPSFCVTWLSTPELTSFHMARRLSASLLPRSGTSSVVSTMSRSPPWWWWSRRPVAVMLVAGRVPATFPLHNPNSPSTNPPQTAADSTKWALWRDAADPTVSWASVCLPRRSTKLLSSYITYSKQTHKHIFEVRLHHPTQLFYWASEPHHSSASATTPVLCFQCFDADQPVGSPDLRLRPLVTDARLQKTVLFWHWLSF